MLLSRMAFKHKRKLGARPYHDYSNNVLQEALAAIRRGEGIRHAARKFGIPRSTLSRKARNLNHNAIGRPKALSDEESQFPREGLLVYAKWACPLNRRDVRKIVQKYLNEQCRIEKRFVNNEPSSAWVRNFINSDPMLSERLAQNVSRARISLTAEIVNEFFDHFEPIVKDVEPELIINYDETCMVDDPGKELVIIDRKEKHAKKIMDTSKAGTSIMFTATAAGVILPPYICYKSKHLYDSWQKGGPPGTIYNNSKSGWFNSIIFENWFEKIIVSYVRRKDPTNCKTKVIIGDNLAAHTSVSVLVKCKKYNIRFVLLPPNTTGDTQPLDVGYFRGLKAVWREVVKEWKEKNKGLIPKDQFPSLLNVTLKKLEKSGRSKKNVSGGFRGSGIYPVDREKVLRKVPQQKGNTNGIAESWTKAFSEPLEKRRAEAYVRRNKRLRVAPGQDLVESVTEEEEQDALMDMTNSEDSDMELGDDVAQDSDNSDVESQHNSPGRNLENEGVEIPLADAETSVLAFEENDFVIGKMIYNYGTRKETTRLFVGRINATKCGRENKQFEVSFLRKKRSIDVNGDSTYHFEYPSISDRWLLDLDQINKEKLKVEKVLRGKYFFSGNIPYNELE